MTGSSGWWSAVSVLSAGWLLAASGVAKLAPSMMFGYVLRAQGLQTGVAKVLRFVVPATEILLAALLVTVGLGMGTAAWRTLVSSLLTFFGMALSGYIMVKLKQGYRGASCGCLNRREPLSELSLLRPAYLIYARRWRWSALR